MELRPEKASREDERKERRRWWSRWLRQASSALGIAQERLAEDVGAGKGKGARWVDPRSPELPSIADIEALDEELARAALEQLAARLGLTVTARVEAPRSRADYVAQVARSTRATSEAHGAVLEGVADDVLTDPELHLAIERQRVALEVVTEGLLALEHEAGRRWGTASVTPIRRPS